eukprot:1189099-Prorocentrum_minimum.AAC.2
MTTRDGVIALRLLGPPGERLPEKDLRSVWSPAQSEWVSMLKSQCVMDLSWMRKTKLSSSEGGLEVAKYTSQGCPNY